MSDELLKLVDQATGGYKWKVQESIKRDNEIIAQLEEQLRTGQYNLDDSGLTTRDDVVNAITGYQASVDRNREVLKELP